MSLWPSLNLPFLDKNGNPLPKGGVLIAGPYDLLTSTEKEIKVPGYIVIALLRAAGGSVTIAAGDGMLDADEQIIQYFRKDPDAVVIKIQEQEVPTVPNDGDLVHVGPPPIAAPYHGMRWRDPDTMDVLVYREESIGTGLSAGWYMFDPIRRYRDEQGEKVLGHPNYGDKLPPKHFTPVFPFSGKFPPKDTGKIWEDPDSGDLLEYRVIPGKTGWYKRDTDQKFRQPSGNRAPSHPHYTKDEEY